MNKNLDVYKYINDGKINQGKEYILLFIYANWCGHCIHTKPIFDKKSTEHKNCCFVKINYEDIPDFLKEQEINGFPTFLLFNKGINGYKIINKGSGTNYLDDFLKEIQKGNQHEYFSPENSNVNADSKKGYSINKIANINLKRLTDSLVEHF